MAGCGGMQQGGASGSDMQMGCGGCGGMQMGCGGCGDMQMGCGGCGGCGGNPMMCNPMQGMMGNPMCNPMMGMMQNMMCNPMMGMMAQMQQMQNMSGMMQGMMPGMSGMSSMPAVSGINQPPPPVAKDTASLEEDLEMAKCTPADLAKLEEEAEKFEADIKKNAKKDAYVGLMARYKEDQGFGFIHCQECKEQWDKTDIYVSGRTFISSGINIGDMVTFRVEKGGSVISSGSNKGMVRAVLPETLHELTKMRKKVHRMRETLRGRKQLAMQGMGAPSGGCSASSLGGGGSLGLVGCGSSGVGLGGCAPQKRAPESLLKVLQGADQGPPAKRTNVGSMPTPAD